jgi:hypothetical protein
MVRAILLILTLVLAGNAQAEEISLDTLMNDREAEAGEYQWPMPSVAAVENSEQLMRWEVRQLAEIGGKTDRRTS